MKRITVIIGITIGTFLIGCTPSPEKVCTHYDGLQSEKKSKKDKDDSKLAEELKSLCPKMLAAVKEDNAEAYKCYAKCVVGTSELDIARKCDNNCDGFQKSAKTAMSKLLKLDDDGDGKKKKSSDDEADDTDKKKKKPADDEADDTTKKKKKKPADDE